MSEDPNSLRSGSLVSSKGIEWSFVWLATGIVGMVLLLFSLLGRKTDEKTPTYENDRQISPRKTRDDNNNRPEIGASENTESA
jgi:hypothetical protein